MWDLSSPKPWIEPGPFAMEALSPTHWTTGNSQKLFLMPHSNVTFSLTSGSSYLRLPTVFSLLFPSFSKWWNKYKTAEHRHNEPHRITTTFFNTINLLYFLISKTWKTQWSTLHMPSWSPSSSLIPLFSEPQEDRSRRGGQQLTKLFLLVSYCLTERQGWSLPGIWHLRR